MERQSFIRGSAVLIGMVAVTKGLGLLYRIPLTSMLGGSGMSCYSGATAAFAPVFAAAAAGAPNAVSRLVSEQTALGCPRNALRIKRAALGAFMLLSLIMSAGLMISAPALAEKVIHIPQAKWAIAAAAPALLPVSLMNVCRGYAEGTGSMTPTALSEIAETLFKLIFGLAGAWTVLHFAERDFGAYHGCFGKYCTDLRAARLTAAPFAAAAAALGSSSASAAACVYISVKSRRLTRRIITGAGKDLLPPVSSRRALSALAGYAAPASFTAVIASLTGMADLLTIPPYLEKAMERSQQLFAFLGSYGIESGDRAGFVYGSYAGLALTVAGLLPTFTAMLGKSSLPRLTAAYAKGDRAGAERCLGSVFLLSSAAALPGGLGITVLSGSLLRLLFAGRTAERIVSERPLAVLGAAVIFTGIALPCLTALHACRKQGQAVLITLSGAAVKLLLNILLIPRPEMNITGAAVSTAVSQGVVCIASVTALVRGTGAGKDCVKKLFSPALPALLCCCAAFLAQKAAENRADGVILRLSALFSIAVGSIMAIISFALLCISPKNEIFSLFSKKITKKP